MFSFNFNSLNIDALGPRNNKMFWPHRTFFSNKSKDLFHTLSAAGQNCDLDVWVALTVLDSFDIVHH